MSKQYPISDEGDRIKVRDSLVAANHLSDDYDVGQTIIEGLLPVGLNLIVGLPKSGKSYLAMGYALSVCTGKTIGEIRPVRTGSCLFFSLETPLSICRNRFGQFLRTDELPPNLLLSGERGQRFSSWLVGLEDALSKYEDTVLVVIDSLALAARESLVRGYNKEYDILDGVRQLAYSRKLAIIVTHHSVKKPGHWVTSAYGSNALTAAADSVQVIDRNNHRLIIGGNGSSDSLFQLDWTDEFPWHPAFRLNSELSELKVTPEQFELLKAIIAFGQNISPKDLETVFAQDRTPSALRKLFKQLTDKFLIVKVGFGKYAVTETGRSFLKQETKLAEIQTRLSGISREPDEALPRVAVEESIEPFAENPVVVDEPVIEPELEAGSPAEPKVDIPTEADAPEGSSPGDHREGKEEAGPSGPPLPSEDTGAADAERESKGPKVENKPIVRPGGRFDVDRPSAEAKRDEFGIRLSKMASPQGADSLEGYRDSLGEKYLDGIYRSPKTLILHLDDPFDLSELAGHPALAKVFEKHSQERVQEALDLLVTFADLRLWACRCDQNRKIQLLPVTGESLPVIRPDGKDCYRARHDACPGNLKDSLASLEPVICPLMGEGLWDEVMPYLMSGYLSVWESERIFESLHRKGRSGRTGMKPAEQTHTLLIQRQSPLEIQAPYFYLANSPERVAYPLRRRQIRESLGLPTWPGDRTVR